MLYPSFLGMLIFERTWKRVRVWITYNSHIRNIYHWGHIYGMSELCLDFYWAHKGDILFCWVIFLNFGRQLVVSWDGSAVEGLLLSLGDCLPNCFIRLPKTKYCYSFRIGLGMGLARRFWTPIGQALAHKVGPEIFRFCPWTYGPGSCIPQAWPVFYVVFFGNFSYSNASDVIEDCQLFLKSVRVVEERVERGKVKRREKIQAGSQGTKD